MEVSTEEIQKDQMIGGGKSESGTGTERKEEVVELEEEVVWEVMVEQLVGRQGEGGAEKAQV